MQQLHGMFATAKILVWLLFWPCISTHIVNYRNHVGWVC